MTGSLAKLTWVEIKLFTRDISTVIFVFLFPPVMLVVLQGVFGKDPTEEWRNVPPTDYYLPGYLAIVIASLGLIGLPVHLASYRERGILRRFRASSMPVWSVFGAQVIVSFAMATIGCTVLVAISTISYDTQLPDSLARVVLAFSVSTLSFVAIGFFLGTVLPTARAAQAAGLVLFFPMWMLSGAGPPREVLGSAMRPISDIMPLTYMVTALQDAWLGLGTSGTELLVLTALMLAAGALSFWFSRAA